MPRFIVFVRATADTEAEHKPKLEDLDTMGSFNARMVEAGIMLSAEGLLPSSRDSLRLSFHDDTQPTVQSGPFPSNELVAGYWILKAKDVEEVTKWLKECPVMKEGNVLEVRKIAEMEDFGDAFSSESREKERELREQTEKLAGK
ncbi:hypothetical protein B7463_g1550, partial [Scytalidium lignicola]